MKRRRPATWNARWIGLALGLLGLWLPVGCDSGSLSDGSAVSVQDRAAGKSTAAERASRRAFDGAPPVIPHEPLGASCGSCHNEEGMAVAGLGFSPPSPHGMTAGMGGVNVQRCEQCHVFQQPVKPWKASTFVGLAQDLRAGGRAYPGAPPVMPHARFMRESCRACHAGPAAREAIRTSHPERARCEQCHVQQTRPPGDFPAVKL